MRMTVSRVALMLRILVLGGSLLGFTGMATSSLASDKSALKLMVARCDGEKWLENAQVDVIIYRPGVGQIDAATAYTNSSGYVEFSFASLAIGDEARTTVTPDDESPDSGHTYYWTMGPGDESSGVWDLGVTGDSSCSDGWYDQNNRVFECLYE
jgi:hypothetical protein